MTHSRLGATLLIALSLVLAGCSSAAPATEPTAEAISTPTPTPTPTATATADPGTRANPLPVGQALKLSSESMWTLGANAPTEVHDGHVVLPLRISFDWEAAAAQGLSPENDGADPAYALYIDYVTADGRTFNTMDNYDVTNEWVNVGTVYPPTESIDTTVPISVPADQVAGGVWKITNSVNDAVFIIGG